MRYINFLCVAVINDTSLFWYICKANNVKDGRPYYS